MYKSKRLSLALGILIGISLMLSDTVIARNISTTTQTAPPPPTAQPQSPSGTSGVPNVNVGPTLSPSPGAGLTPRSGPPPKDGITSIDVGPNPQIRITPVNVRTLPQGPGTTNVRILRGPTTTTTTVTTTTNTGGGARSAPRRAPVSVTRGGSGRISSQEKLRLLREQRLQRGAE